MTELPDPLPLTSDDDAESAASRRHALWALVVLGCLAVIVGCLMVLLGGGGKTRHAANILPPVQTPATSPHHSVGAESTSHRPPSDGSSQAGSSRSTPSTPAGAIRHGNPCSASATCVVNGDGGALAAVNAFRTGHGLPAVTGGVSANAQTCAQNKGSGSTCVPHYAWTSLPNQNGAKAVAKIAAFGSDWLLDRSTQTVSVGWAYVGGAYECVLLKAP